MPQVRGQEIRVRSHFFSWEKKRIKKAEHVGAIRPRARFPEEGRVIAREQPGNDMAGRVGLEKQGALGF